MLSDNSSVDHPLCEECTDTLLQCLELQLEQAEQDSQQYQVIFIILVHMIVLFCPTRIFTMTDRTIVIVLLLRGKIHLIGLISTSQSQF